MMDVHLLWLWPRGNSILFTQRKLSKNVSEKTVFLADARPANVYYGSGGEVDPIASQVDLYDTTHAGK
jgi:hypothetical protein